MSMKCIAAVLAVVVSPLAAVHAADSATPTPPPALRGGVIFEANDGQAGRDVRFIARAGDISVFVYSDELIITAPEPEPVNRAEDLRRARSGERRQDERMSLAVMRMKLRGANRRASVVGQGTLSSVSHYLTGDDPSKWRTNVRHFAGVRIGDVYPGVDLVLARREGKFAYDFVVAPQADPSVIDVEIEGPSEAAVTQDGRLEVATRRGRFRHASPVSFAGAGERRVPARSRFVSRGRNRIGFAVEGWSRREALTIDPTIDYERDYGDYPIGVSAVAADRRGQAYVAGTAYGTTIPEGPQRHIGTEGPAGALFVSKFNANGTELLFTTYLGQGGSFSYAGVYGLAVDAGQRIFLTGHTGTGSFPITMGGTPTGNFALRLNADGASLRYSRYLPAVARGVAVDSRGNAYLPVTVCATPSPCYTGGWATGAERAHLIKLRYDGLLLFNARVLTNDTPSRVWRIAIDSRDRLKVTGQAQVAGFPEVSGYRSTVGTHGVLVASLDKYGTLLNAALLGGSAWENSSDIAVSPTGATYVVGNTSSLDFPTMHPSQPQPHHHEHADTDAFVVRLNPDLTALEYSTYLHGDLAWTAGEVAEAMTVDRWGNVYVSGWGTWAFMPDAYRVIGWLVTMSPQLEVVTNENKGDLSSYLPLAVDDQGRVYMGAVTGLNAQPVVDLMLYRFKAAGVALHPSDRECQASIHKPVNVFAGNVWLDQTDVALPGKLPLAFTRSYNSRGAAEGRLGNLGLGWVHPYQSSVRRLPSGTYELHKADGIPIQYADENEDDKFEAVAPASDQTWLVVEESGIVWRQFPQGGSEIYQADGRLSVVTDATGASLSLTYTPEGLLDRVTEPGGRFLQLQHDEHGMLSELAGPAGVIARYTHDEDHKLLLSVEYLGGEAHHFKYDDYGQLLTLSDATGRIVERHAYDDQFRGTLSEIEGGAEKHVLRYETNKTTVTNGLGHSTVYEWAEIGGTRLVKKRTGACASCGSGVSEEWTYYPNGRVETHKDANGKITSFTYNVHGDLETETDPLLRVTSYAYTYEEGSGRILTMTRTAPGEGTVTTAFGIAGPETVTQQVTVSESRATHMTYFENRLETVTNPRGKITTYEYYPNGDLQRVVDPLGKAVATYTYDELGRVKTVTNAVNTQTTMHYDPRGRVKRVVQHDGTETKYVYDKSGRRTEVIDPLDRKTISVYDTQGRLSSVVDPLKQTTSYQYDAMSQLIALRDAKGQKSTFHYDAHGRLDKMTYPGGRFETYTYHPTGEMETRTDRKGVVTTFIYDDVRRLRRKTFSNGDPDVVYEYDTADRLESAANSTDTLSWTYDLAGQMLTETSARNSSVVEYGHDPAGNRLTLKLNGTLHASYAYDDAGRLDTITRATQVFDFGYDDAGRRQTLQYPNGVLTTYGYDDLSRLLSISAVRSGSTVLQAIYQYDAPGNRTSKRIADATSDITEQYGYDALSRLTRVDRTGSSTLRQVFGYDPVGNRVTNQQDNFVTTSAHNVRNELTSQAGGGALRFKGVLDEPGTVTVNGQPAAMLPGNTFEANVTVTAGTNVIPAQAQDGSGNTRSKQYQVDIPNSAGAFTYDDNGNLTSKTDAGHTWTYEWNGQDQLTRVSKDGAEVARFVYDPLGRRVEKVVAAVVAAYSYDGQDVLRETKGGTARIYVQGPNIDEPLAHEEDAAMTYYHADGLGSIVATTGAAGTVASRRQYDAWGNIDSGTSASGYAFTGREWDAEIDLYYYRARYYDPKAARFIGEDPIEFEGGINFYTYVDSTPIELVDPFGLAPHGKRKLDVGGLTKKSTVQQIEQAISQALAAGKSAKHLQALRGLLKVVKRGGSMAFVCYRRPPGEDKRIAETARQILSGEKTLGDVLRQGWEGLDQAKLQDAINAIAGEFLPFEIEGSTAVDAAPVTPGR